MYHMRYGQVGFHKKDISFMRELGAAGARAHGGSEGVWLSTRPARKNATWFSFQRGGVVEGGALSCEEWCVVRRELGCGKGEYALLP